MKSLKISLLLLLVSFLGYGQLKFQALPEHVEKYREFLEPNGWEITPGKDAVIDTWTHDKNPGSVALNKVDEQLPFLQEGSKIFLDAKALQGIRGFELSNRLSSRDWPVKNIEVILIPNAQLVFQPDVYSQYGPFKLLAPSGVTKLKFRSKQFPTHLGWSSTDKHFVRDLFGFDVNADGMYGVGKMLVEISAEDGGTVDVDGLAAGMGGFAALRVGKEQKGKVCTFNFRNCLFYMPDSETIYAQATQEAPYVIAENCEYDNVLIAYAGSEGLQVQCLGNGNRFKNLSIINSSVDVVDPFQPNQIGCIQAQFVYGNSSFESILVDGFQAPGLSVHGRNESRAIGGEATFDLFVVGGNSGFFHQNKSASNGMKYRFKNLHLYDFDQDLAANIGTKEAYAFFADKMSAKDSVIIENIFTDFKFPVVGKETRYKISSQKEVETIVPRYRNPGIWERDVFNWAAKWGSHYPNPNNTPLSVKEGAVCFDRVLGQPQQIYKAKKAHTVDLKNPKRPREDPENWYLLTWDSKGVRCDAEGWNKNDPQRLDPPMNYLQADNSPEICKSYGIYETVVPRDPDAELIAKLIEMNAQLKAEVDFLKAQIQKTQDEHAETKKLLLEAETKVMELSERANKSQAYRELVKRVIAELLQSN